GKAGCPQLAAARAKALAAASDLGDRSYDAPAYAAALAAGSPLDATDAAEIAAEGVTGTPADLLQEKAAQAELLRDILGNPFRPPARPGPAVLAWNGGPIPRLARTIYEEWEFPSGNLDTARLAVLADALEDAGCTDAALLGHLRGPGPHVRGCWVVD